VAGRCLFLRQTDVAMGKGLWLEGMDIELHREWLKEINSSERKLLKRLALG
jgi:hypothetical protein